MRKHITHKMSFDTATNNSRVNSGTCILFAKRIKRSLLSFAYQHYHIMEFIERVFNILMEALSDQKSRFF